MMKGIDLSTWQENVDYQALKDSGIDFAILRCGYGKDALQKDEMFEVHYQGCKEAGIKVGAYHYSYCTSVENAELEAQNCLSYIEGKDFDLPIYYDLEESRTAQLGIDQVTQIALIFCRTIRNAGYNAGVYANLNWFNNYIRPQALILENFSIWLAQWSNTMDADFPVDIWQFTNNIDDLHIDGNKLLNESILNSEPEPTPQPEPQPSFDDKTDELLAIEVINGYYGNGQERKDILGSRYDNVQDIVNDILLNGNIEPIAQNVIRGVYGNGQERKDILGCLYDEVQDRVNDILL